MHRHGAGEPDEAAAAAPFQSKGSEQVVPVDVAVLAIGLLPSTAHFPAGMKNGKGLLIADPQTCQTADPDVFACGDCVTAPTMIVNAVAQGRRAAFYMDRHLKGESMNAPFDGVLEKTDKNIVLEEAKGFVERRPFLSTRCRSRSAGKHSNVTRRR